jgi:hypothetical protein
MKSRTYKLEDAFIVDSDLDNTNLNGPTWDHSSQASISLTVDISGNTELDVSDSFGSRSKSRCRIRSGLDHES